MKNRGNKILELLTKDNKIEVSHLAEELGEEVPDGIANAWCFRPRSAAIV